MLRYDYLPLTNILFELHIYFEYFVCDLTYKNKGLYSVKSHCLSACVPTMSA